MKPMSSASRAISLALILAALNVPSEARTRPRWGGRAVIELRESSMEIDPRSDRTSATLRQQIAPLVFESLTILGASGAVEPGLAASWTRVHATRWAFTLRADASFSDGTAVTASQVASSLAGPLRDAKISAQDASTVVIDTPQPWDNLPEILSFSRFAIVKENGPLPIGSGSYKIADWQPGRGLVLTRNIEYDGAAPYLETIEVRFNENAGSTFAVNGIDLDEIGLEQARSMGANSGKRSDEASELYVLRWNEGVRIDDRVRKAMAATIDRSSLALPFSRDGATPASGYLPQSVSGYEFLFEQKPDIAQARALVRDAGWRLPLPIAYRASDAVARLIAERIAVNAREAGLNVQPLGEKDTLGTSAAVARIVRLPVTESPAATLFDIAASLGLASNNVLGDDDAGRLLSVERDLLNDTRAMPLLHLPAIIWQSRRLHDVESASDWQLDSAWVSVGVPQ